MGTTLEPGFSQVSYLLKYFPEELQSFSDSSNL